MYLIFNKKLLFLIFIPLNIKNIIKLKKKKKYKHKNM